MCPPMHIGLPLRLVLIKFASSRRIVELENEIGAGLIEEVIQVAEGELKLVQTMAEAKV